LKDGLFSETYQSLMLDAVANPEIPPIANGMRMQIKNVVTSFIVFIY
jgi:hypothetical protein